MPEIVDNVKVGQFLKEQLKEQKISQDALAQKLNITKSAVSQNLNGKSSFSRKNLEVISELLNMKIEDIRKAVKIRNNTEFKSHHLPSKLEASGGIYLDNIKDYASTGVDIISVGELTDSVKSVDISLDVI